MSFLLPLGFLGLLGIGALILIYIIKPNYQQKFVSSTYVWKLSLKYRKKNIPINRFRNILIFLCQLLILIACALLLARPVILAEKQDDRPEQIAIIDASASMRVSSGDITRFERAVEEVKSAARQYAENGGLFSVILADGNAHYLVQRAAAESLDDTIDLLDDLVAEGELKCSYASADLTGAVSIAETVVNQNPEAEVTVYTATTYLDKSGLNVVNVAQKGEWNAAVLNAEATLVDNFYSFVVDVGYYGEGARKITVYCTVTDVNGTEIPIEMSKSETFDNTEQEKRITFGIDEQLSSGVGSGSGSSEAQQIYSFNTVHVSIKESDSFSEDNDVYIYGGIKPVIKVQYASTAPCPFFRNQLFTLRSFVQNNWEVELTEVTKKDDVKTEGYDFYLFEGLMPAVMPTDGTVLIFNPGSTAIEGLGIEFESKAHDVNRDSTLAMASPHVITDKIDPERITVSSYWAARSYEGYQELLLANGNPALLVREEKEFTYIVFTFDVHMSNLPILPEFPLMFYTMFNTYVPVTVSSFAYEVGDTVTFNARGETLDVTGPNLKMLIETFPQQYTVTLPGSYTMNQVVRDNVIQEQFFVKVSAYESNITKEVDSLPLLERTSKKDSVDSDLLIYFAAALIALLFLEWWLQSRENLR